MNKMHIAALAAGLLVAGAASAADVNLGTGPGTYDFSGKNVGTDDSSFFVNLLAGEYIVSGEVWAETTAINKAWLSSSDDAKFKPNVANSNDFVKFDGIPGTHKHDLTLTNYVLDLSQDTTLFINVDSKKNKPFWGEVTITSAVPEPASTALLLAGLGMLAFVGRRRQG